MTQLHERDPDPGPTEPAELVALTPRQRQLFDFVCAHRRRRGYAPTVREICDHMGIASSNGVMDHLKALDRKGWVRWTSGQSRTLRPTRAALRQVKMEGAR